MSCNTRPSGECVLNLGGNSEKISRKMCSLGTVVAHGCGPQDFPPKIRDVSITLRNIFIANVAIALLSWMTFLP